MRCEEVRGGARRSVEMCSGMPQKVGKRFFYRSGAADDVKCVCG